VSRMAWAISTWIGVDWIGVDWTADMAARELATVRRRLGSPLAVDLRVVKPSRRNGLPDRLGVTMIGWYEVRDPNDTGERVCPECWVERTDWEHDAGGFLGRCPNCGARSAPVRAEEVSGA
jgi:hypothetical protein